MKVTIEAGQVTLDIGFDGTIEASFPRTRVKQVRVLGNGGDDGMSVFGTGPLPVTMSGGPGDDFVGTLGDFLSDGTNDAPISLSGDDGNDRLSGSTPGPITMTGGLGDDDGGGTGIARETVSLGDGNDTFRITLDRDAGQVSTTVDAGAGQDAMEIGGTFASESMLLSASGGHLIVDRAFRNKVDVDNLEDVSYFGGLDISGSGDAVAVNDAVMFGLWPALLLAVVLGWVIRLVAWVLLLTVRVADGLCRMIGRQSKYIADRTVVSLGYGTELADALERFIREGQDRPRPSLSANASSTPTPRSANASNESKPPTATETRWLIGGRWGEHRGMTGANGVAAVEVRGLTKTFSSGRGKRRRDVKAVRDLSFRVDPGERVAYIGPNGAGKSTSIKIMTGILHATEGDVRVLGLVPWQDRRRLTRRIGTLFGQRSQLWFELTPQQSFRMLAAIHRIDKADAARRVAELAALLDAGDLFDTPVRNLSLGQRMRCELAACMLHRPEILFLDEPTIGLDLLAKQLFRDLLVRLNGERGTTIFLTSHDVADVESVAERVVVVNHGAIIYDDSVARMRRTLLATKLIEIGLSAEIEAPDIVGVTVLRHSPKGVKLVVDTTVRSVREVLDHVLDSWPVADMSVVDPPLEDVIAEIYGAPHP